MFIDLAHRLSGYANGRTMTIISIVTIRHDGIHAVVSAGEFHHNKYFFRFTRLSTVVGRGSQRGSGSLKEGGQSRGNAKAVKT